jgi:serine protease inhibitor
LLSFSPRPLPPSEDDLVASKAIVPVCNEFAIKLLKQAVNTTPRDNVTISSAGTFLSLAVLLNGAGGDTRKTLARVLGVDEADISSFNDNNAALLRSLKSDDPQVKLSLETSLWLSDSDSFKQDYLDTCANAYGAKLDTLDFKSPTAESIINEWVSKNTSGRIEGSIGSLSSDVVSVVINAAYFIGIWTDRFAKNKTKDELFMLADGKQVTVPMMNQKTTCGYSENELFHAISLPYGNARYSMIILLPPSHSDLGALSSKLTIKDLEESISGLEEREVFVMMPRFGLEKEADMKALLSALGLGIMFDPSRADFTSAVRENVWVDLVQQRTFLEINERGTEIAIAIHISLMKSAGPTRFVADHPFFYAIRDNLTKTILFMGTVMDPSRD